MWRNNSRRNIRNGCRSRNYYLYKKKAQGKHQDIFEQFTPELVHHELLGEDCVCPECQHTLKEIGSCVKRKEVAPKVLN